MTASGVLPGPKWAKAESGTIVSLDVLTGAPVDVAPCPVLARELLARLRAVSLAICAVAALNLVLDFDLIESGARQGAPRYMEWYSAFGLLVTLVWLYMEMLRLLSRLQRRN